MDYNNYCLDKHYAIQDKEDEYNDYLVRLAEKREEDRQYRLSLKERVNK